MHSPQVGGDGTHGTFILFTALFGHVMGTELVDAHTIHFHVLVFQRTSYSCNHGWHTSNHLLNDYAYDESNRLRARGTMSLNSDLLATMASCMRCGHSHTGSQSNQHCRLLEMKNFTIACFGLAKSIIVLISSMKLVEHSN